MSLTSSLAIGRMPATGPAPLSPRIHATQAPPIPTVRGWAARYRGQAGPVLDLTQAVPGYPPHPDLLARIAEAAGSRTAAGYGPIDGEPAETVAIVQAYADWMDGNDIPKLFIDADPGSILIGRQREFCRGWPNQTERRVVGMHFVQEDSPDDIGEAVAEWLTT